MQRVVVIGCPGSGKSTFARRLHDITKIPLYHLDMMYWREDKSTVPLSLFRQRLGEVVGQDSWILDGNYGSTMEFRMRNCDTVFFLDYPLEVCLAGVQSRKGKARSDMPWTETEDDEEFLMFIRNYRSVSRPIVMQLLEKYAGKKIYVFTDRRDADDFLFCLQKNEKSP